MGQYLDLLESVLKEYGPGAYAMPGGAAGEAETDPVTQGEIETGGDKDEARKSLEMAQKHTDHRVRSANADLASDKLFGITTHRDNDKFGAAHHKEMSELHGLAAKVATTGQAAKIHADTSEYHARLAHKAAGSPGGVVFSRS